MNVFFANSHKYHLRFKPQASPIKYQLAFFLLRILYAASLVFSVECFARAFAASCLYRSGATENYSTEVSIALAINPR